MEENKFSNKGGDAVNLGKTFLEFGRAVWRNYCFSGASVLAVT